MELVDIVIALEAIVAALDPDLIDGAQAARLVETFAKGERLCSAGRAVAAGRVQATNAWKVEGFRSAGEWLAAKTKVSQSDATETLNTARQIQTLPATREAYLAGQVSAEQAAAIASAATADPDAERRLLREADRSSLQGLQREARAVRVAALGNQDLGREQVHRSRYLRTWTSRDGAFEGRFRLTTDHGAIVAAALDIEHAAAFARAKVDGRYETSEAYAADALVNLARTTLEAGEGIDHGGGDQESDDHSPRHPVRSRRPRSWPRTVLNVRVDYTALRRGYTRPGETCEITNHGPIPVDLARHAAEDAFIRLHLYRDDQLIHVHNHGRTIPATMRYGLEQRDRICSVPGCDAARHLEIHHIHGYALGGPTSLTNLCRICPYHHDLITNHGAAITGIPGHWVWHPPAATPNAPPAAGPASTGGSSARLASTDWNSATPAPATPASAGPASASAGPASVDPPAAGPVSTDRAARGEEASAQCGRQRSPALADPEALKLL